MRRRSDALMRCKIVTLPPPENLSGMHTSEAALMTSFELRAHIAKLADSRRESRQPGLRLVVRATSPDAR